MPPSSKTALDSSPSDDICPVCKSNRYLNPNLQFLINPECYHRMCSVCVDRIFSSGPSVCPVPFCGLTLRKKGFHKAFFADLKVEREVDVRKRVGQVFNRRQEEFEDLLTWNDYLEMVEGLIFDIVEGGKGDRERAEERLRMEREANREGIEENRRVEKEEVETGRRREIEDQERARERRLLGLRAEEEQKKEVERLNNDVLDKLQKGEGDAVEVTRRAQKVLLKKTSARRQLVDDVRVRNGMVKDLDLSIRGLKRKAEPVIEKPYDPFGGMDLTPTRYVLQGDYENEWLATWKGTLSAMTGGYSMQEYYARTMLDAFSGLGVFIEDEVAGRSAGSPGIGTIAAVEVLDGKKAKSLKAPDDVF